MTAWRPARHTPPVCDARVVHMVDTILRFLKELLWTDTGDESCAEESFVNIMNLLKR